MSRSTLVDERGRVFVFRDSDGKNKQQVPPGWEKGWILENVYGWQWIGPLDRYPYVNLRVLPYEPTLEERQRIEAEFRGVPTPDGAEELIDPF